MRRSSQVLLVLAGFAAAPGLQAQAPGTVTGTPTAPQIQFTAVEALSGNPNDAYLGEVAGIATNSRGEIYVYTRTGNPVVTLGAARYQSHGGSRLFKYNARGVFEKEVGQGSYGFLQAQQVRVDAQDNVWIVDQMSGQVVRFDPQGKQTMVLSRKPEAQGNPTTFPPEPLANGGIGAEGESFQRPTDVAWDAQGNIYVADGIRNSRIAKYDANGKWVRNWGRQGNQDGQFNVIMGIQIAANGDVYVADRGNQRIQIFDGNGTFKRSITGFGAPTAICISSGNPQFLFVSNSSLPTDPFLNGEIYKLSLDGTIVGRFGKGGKKVGDFGAVNAIDCRNPNELLVGELANWRAQRVTLR